MQFEWDDVKARANVRKHKIGFAEAMSCFYDPQQVAFYDPDHSKAEERELLVGHSNKGRLLIVIYTIRTDTIRIISARRATRQEAKIYAQGI